MEPTEKPRGTYLMVLPVPFRRTAEGRFASESAFACHLRLLKHMLGRRFSTFIVAGAESSAEDYERAKTSWVELDERAEGIFFHALYPVDASHAAFAKLFPGILRDLRREVARAGVVHAGPSFLYRPVSIFSLLLGKRLGKVTISVTDIDQRESARMNLETGRWSRREYWTTRLIHQTWDHLQHRLIANICSVVLLKGQQLAEDYGEGRPNVHNFLDSAYNKEHLIPSDVLERKLERLADANRPLRLTFYGRLVAYKGIDHMLRALGIARVSSRFSATFDIYGDGPEREALERITLELGLEGVVRFHGSVPFGTEFFEVLRDLDVLLAAPLSQDTPRSALDAQAVGQYVLAYDTYYYRDLAKSGAAVGTVPWRDERALGERLVHLHRNRSELVDAILRGASFARANTQEQWLERRVAWTEAALEQSLQRGS
jgi:glycosyltransferase involved in cell wall biosynthesis